MFNFLAKLRKHSAVDTDVNGFLQQMLSIVHKTGISPNLSNPDTPADSSWKFVRVHSSCLAFTPVADDWNFNALSESGYKNYSIEVMFVESKTHLANIGSSILQVCGLLNAFGISEEVFYDWASAVAASYKENPYMYWQQDSLLPQLSQCKACCRCYSSVFCNSEALST